MRSASAAHGTRTWRPPLPCTSGSRSRGPHRRRRAWRSSPVRPDPGCRCTRRTRRQRCEIGRGQRRARAGCAQGSASMEHRRRGRHRKGSQRYHRRTGGLRRRSAAARRASRISGFEVSGASRASGRRRAGDRRARRAARGRWNGQGVHAPHAGMRSALAHTILPAINRPVDWFRHRAAAHWAAGPQDLAFALIGCTLSFVAARDARGPSPASRSRRAPRRSDPSIRVARLSLVASPSERVAEPEERWIHLHTRRDRVRRPAADSGGVARQVPADGWRPRNAVPRSGGHRPAGRSGPTRWFRPRSPAASACRQPPASTSSSARPSRGHSGETST